MIERYLHVRSEAKRRAVSVFDLEGPERSPHIFQHSRRWLDAKISCKCCKIMVGAEGFEPPTLCSQSRCATRLRYAPTCCFDCIVNRNRAGFAFSG